MGRTSQKKRRGPKMISTKVTKPAVHKKALAAATRDMEALDKLTRPRPVDGVLFGTSSDEEASPVPRYTLKVRGIDYFRDVAHIMTVLKTTHEDIGAVYHALLAKIVRAAYRSLLVRRRAKLMLGDVKTGLRDMGISVLGKAPTFDETTILSEKKAIRAKRAAKKEQEQVSATV